MKNIITIASLLFFFFGFSQNEIANKVKEYENQKAIFKSISPLTQDSSISSKEVNKTVEKSTLAKINFQSVGEVVSNKYDFIELQIPYNGSVIIMNLYKVNLFTENFQIDTNYSRDISYQKGVYYRGIVKGDYKSVASFSFFENEFNGVVSSQEVANLVVGKLDKVNNISDYIVYSDANFKVSSGFNCSVKDDESKIMNTSEVANKNVVTARCVTMYFEIDYNLFQSNSSSTTTTTNWMTSVFNNVQTLYSNDGISTALKSMFIWTTQDPYTGSASTDYLFQFHDLRPVFNGDVGQLVGIDPGGLGGVAVSINGLCTQDNFCYSDVNFSYSTVPTYSWTIEVITHEFGHLLGSRHTHACAWNGNNTAIDNCGPVGGGTAEGSTCVTSPPTIPSTTIRGTIMSYCHLTSSGISFSNGFGPQPRTAIQNAVDGVFCLSFDCVSTCINFVSSVTTSNITNTTATISFIDTSGATSWQRAVKSFSSSFSNWLAVTSNPFNVTGLLPNTYYSARVRPTCTSGVTAGSKDAIFATTANYCSGIIVTDTGGTAGDYTDNQSFVRIIAPNIAGQKVTMTFSSFSLELNYDYLFMYNGNSISAPSFNTAGYTGTTIPGPFTSTTSDGSLTMRFESDPGVVDQGWVATTSCSALGTNEFNGIDFTYYPNPTNDNVTIVSKTEISKVSVYNVTGQLLYQNDINDLNTKVDISSFAVGTYFFKVKFEGEREVNFKVLRK
ncbi:M12 family metallo-peptidase [Flavobacterium sp.]|uniref:M12 family metallo-peptidase n=1 Tax=Flavobacterium sp. TaxID=239 RepID=UPI003752A433